MSLNFSFVFGTRPELVKLAPLILLAQKDPKVDVEVIFTAQHDELVQDSLVFFDIPIHRRLDMMRPGQSLARSLSRGIGCIDDILIDGKNRDVIFAQGDTTTVLAAALCAFLHRVPFAHVEAGLRSFDMAQPFPEEGHRQLAARIARWHFPPTETAASNLRGEGVAGDRILVTGNTVVDAVHLARKRLRDSHTRDRLLAQLAQMGVDADILKNCVLVTAHRRENFDGGIRNICLALRELSGEHPDLHFLWPVHKNPNVVDVVTAELSGIKQVHLLPPLDYASMMLLLESARFSLTDSGGIQEESPSFEKPVLVLRELTERPEVIECGAGRLVGTDVDTIVKECDRLLSDRIHYQTMASAPNPFGDGHASEYILDKIKLELLGNAPMPQRVAR